MEKPKLIQGGVHSDNRGTLGFFNDFDMSQICRFYTIEHPDTTITRGWRAHRIEQRWFHAVKGTFSIKIVEIDNWDQPSPALEQQIFVLRDSDNSVLHVPKGYATSLQALEQDSKIIVFADADIKNAALDNYLFPSDYFNKKNIKDEN